MKKKIEYEVGSDNVFADIGRPGTGEHLIKAHLVFKIGRTMKERGLKQIEGAGLFGVKHPHVSNMLRGSFRQFSVERLMRFLGALGQDFEIRRATRRHMRSSAARSAPPRHRPRKGPRSGSGYPRDEQGCHARRSQDQRAGCRRPAMSIVFDASLTLSWYFEDERTPAVDAGCDEVVAGGQYQASASASVVDILTPERRSTLMRLVGGKDTEMIVRRLVHGLGFRYRLHRKGLPGRPELVFPIRRVSSVA